MMYEFLIKNRAELNARCRIKVAARKGRSASADQLNNGVPMFLEQLIRTLQADVNSAPSAGTQISGPAGGDQGSSEMGTTAALHGQALLELDFTVDEVVHDYGDLCQVITDLAIERNVPFEVTEFRILNRCLDNAIADAVTAVSDQRDFANAGLQEAASNERLGFLVHEIRNHLGTISLAYVAVKSGSLPLAGATGTILGRSITKLSKLIDEGLANIKEIGYQTASLSAFPLHEFITEAESAARLLAEASGNTLVAAPVDEALTVFGGRAILLSALGNLLQNALKFTRPQGEVTVSAHASSDRIYIEVRDCCGGLPQGAAATMFQPFSQVGTNRTGIGLGLAISKEGVEANKGTLTVRDIPGSGCVFTMELPRYAIPDPPQLH
jgi:signal transduction histidine kinase